MPEEPTQAVRQAPRWSGGWRSQSVQPSPSPPPHPVPSWLVVRGDYPSPPFQIVTLTTWNPDDNRPGGRRLSLEVSRRLSSTRSIDMKRVLLPHRATFYGETSWNKRIDAVRKGEEQEEKTYALLPNQAGFHSYWQPTAGWRDREMVIKKRGRVVGGQRQSVASGMKYNIERSKHTLDF